MAERIPAIREGFEERPSAVKARESEQAFRTQERVATEQTQEQNRVRSLIAENMRTLSAHQFRKQLPDGTMTPISVNEIKQIAEDWAYGRPASVPVYSANQEGVESAREVQRQAIESMLVSVKGDPAKLDPRIQQRGITLGMFEIKDGVLFRKGEEYTTKTQKEEKFDPSTGYKYEATYKTDPRGNKVWMTLAGTPAQSPEWRLVGGPTPSREGKEDAKFAVTLRKEFNALQPVKDYRDIHGKVQLMNEAMEESKTTKNFVAVDQALITMFNKITDPQSVVRESEYARTQKDLSLINRVRSEGLKIFLGGRLTPEDRDALVTMAKRFADAQYKIYKNYENEYRGYASTSGVDPNNVITPLGSPGVSRSTGPAIKSKTKRWNPKTNQFEEVSE